MAFLAFLTFVVFCLFVAWMFFRDIEESAQVEKGRQERFLVDEARNALFHWWKSRWGIPSAVFIVALVISSLDFTKEPHLWLQISGLPLLAVATEPGRIRFSRGDTENISRIQTFVLLSETGKAIAPKRVTGNVTYYDQDACPFRVFINPACLMQFPHASRMSSSFSVPYWFFGLASACSFFVLHRRFEKPHS